MRVLKRTGDYEDVSFDKVLNRIKLLSTDLSVDIYDVSQKVCSRIFDGVKTSELDELAAHLCSSMVVDNPDYGVMASRLIISNHHKNTSPSFSETIITLYNNQVEGEHSPLISDTVYQIVMKNKEKLNSYIDYKRDYNFDYFGFKTLERSYLIKVDKKITERPQHMFMRVSLGIHSDDLKEALQTYDLMSNKFFTHATPTLFNAGTITPQNSSCYLVSMIGDSISSIMDTMKDCALISKYSGGIGLHVHNVRAKASRIRSTNGESDGLLPMLKVFNHLGRYVNQCFVPDTMVFAEKGISMMSNIVEGDKLLTFDFNTGKSIMKPVLSISTSEIDKDILEIKTYIGTKTVKVTKEHELYVRRESGKSFIPASELKVGDLMCYPEKESMFWFKVDSIDIVPYKGLVYDFNMEDNHNYTVVNLGLVHNSGKRNGSIAIYLEPWHADIETFLDLKKNHGDEEMRARDLFYALWTPDLFMKRVKEDGVWSLMCPDKCKGLSDVYGEEFVELYEKYERDGKYNKQMKAQDLWFKIMESQIETGVPYMLYKDAANKKSNQKNLGTIKSSNLCVAGDTLILTSKGYYPIEQLHGTQIEVWNGDEFSATTVMKTGENQALLTVEFSNRSKLKCTPYHKFYIEEDDKCNVYEAKDLTGGMKILPYQLPDAMNVMRHVTIVSIKDEGIIEDTYCFNEPKKNRGIFNGILAGNCCEIIEYSAPDECAVCLTGDTEILTENGIRMIKDIKNEKIVSYFDSDDKLQFKQDIYESTLISNGIKDVHEIKFAGNKPIKATDNHKFLVFKNRNYNTKKNIYEWRAVKDLKSNDRIVMPSMDPLPSFKDIDISKDIDNDYLVVGWMTGDGWQVTNKTRENYGVCFGPNETFAQEKVIKDIHKSLPTAPMGHSNEVNSYTQKNCVVNWQSSKKSFVEHFKEKCELMPKLGKNKIVSQKIKEARPEQIASYLSGLFSADGSVYMNKKFYVSLSSASETLLHDVQSLLRCFGIKSRVVYSEVKSRKRFQGHLSIYDKKNISRFYKYINFKLCKEKEDKLLSGLKTVEYIRESERDWCTIKSITYVGKEEVYDLNIPETHNFIANGVVTHNCNLSSICLPTFIATNPDGTKYYDFEKLHEISMIITKNLNKIIDVNFYPIEKAYTSNMKHRPIGLGIQGLADTYILMGYPFDSQEACDLNKNIFETIYHGAVEASMLIAKKRTEYIKELEKGVTKDREVEISKYLKLNTYEKLDNAYPGAYSTFVGSPASQGILQFDMWNYDPGSDRYDWIKLKELIKQWGLRNSLLLAPMPTASTSQIMGFTESFECITSNLYKRKTMAGEFVMLNKYLVNDLKKVNLWNKDMKNKIMLEEGSIQAIDEIPQKIKDLYKTAWEISQKIIIDQAADRGVFICQSQSMNIFIEDPNFQKLTSMHFYGWNKGLKTGSYYIRSKPRAKVQQFTIDPNFVRDSKKTPPKECIPDEETGSCKMCSS